MYKSGCFNELIDVQRCKTEVDCNTIYSKNTNSLKSQWLEWSCQLPITMTAFLRLDDL